MGEVDGFAGGVWGNLDVGGVAVAGGNLGDERVGIGRLGFRSTGGLD